MIRLFALLVGLAQAGPAGSPKPTIPQPLPEATSVAKPAAVPAGPEVASAKAALPQLLQLEPGVQAGEGPEGARPAALEAVFDGGGLESSLDGLTTTLRQAEARHLSTMAQRSPAPAPAQPLAQAAQATLSLARARAARAAQPKGLRLWVSDKLGSLMGELREKIDIPGTVRKIRGLAVSEGPSFAIFYAVSETLEQVGIPLILKATGHPALIPLALGFHLEFVTIPAYFAVRHYLSVRRLWRIAGGRQRYAELADFRKRLLNEDPGRRIEKLFLRGFPAQSEHGVIAVNVNKSILPRWVPLRVRNWADRDYRWYDLYISINELATLAPRPLVKELRPYYKDFPRAVSTVLVQAILEGGSISRARLIQNLSFKYWQNVGFDDLQPRALPYLDAKERELSEANRQFASGFFIQARPPEEAQIKVLVSDAYALAAVARATGLRGAQLFEALAPFLKSSYPWRESEFTARAWQRSPLGIARTQFVLNEMVAAGLAAEGETITVAGQPVAVIEKGAPRFLGARAERALAEHRSSLNGAVEYLRRYRVLHPGAFKTAADDQVDDQTKTEALTIADAAAQSVDSHLLLKIRWLKQSVLPELVERLARQKRRRDVKRARLLQGRLDELETSWLRDYFEDRFRASESHVSGYVEAEADLRAIESEAGALGTSR